MEKGKEKKTNNSSSNNKALESISMQLAALLEMNKKQQEETALMKQEIAELKKGQETQVSEEVEDVREENEEPVIVPAVEDTEDNLKADRMVEIIHLAERAPGLTTTLFLADGRSLIFRRYGDSVRVRYFEFQQLISTYYDLFFKNIIFTVGKKDQDVALAERLPSAGDRYLTKDEVRSLLTLSPKQLEDVFNRVCDSHKELILSTWQRGFYLNEDPEYRNLDKVNALNKVSGNRLKTVYENIVDPIVKG